MKKGYGKNKRTKETKDAKKLTGNHTHVACMNEQNTTCKIQMYVHSIVSIVVRKEKQENTKD